MQAIQAKDIEAFKMALIGKVSNSTVNLKLRHTSAAFTFAMNQGYIEKNPCTGVKKLKVKGNNLPKYFSKEDAKNILQIIPDGRFEDLIYFYLYTGCRRDEALNLKWEDIDLKNRRVIFRETKSGKSRMVPFNGQLSEVLVRMEQNPEKPFPFKSDFVTKKFKKYLKASSIKNADDLCVHSLRHSFASHLVMENVPIKTVSKLLGHSTIRVTEMYAHLAPDHLKDAVQNLRY